MADDLWTDDERWARDGLVALQEPVPFSQIRWGSKRRRSEPAFEFPSEPEPGSATSSDEEEKRKKKHKAASPATTLAFPTSGDEEPMVIAPLKPVKKANSTKQVRKFRVWFFVGEFCPPGLICLDYGR